MPYEKIEGSQFVNLEVAETIEGKLEAIREGQYGDVYDLVKVDGTSVTLGSKSALGNRIKEHHVGRKLRITRGEDIKSKAGRMYQDFTVEVEK